MMLATPCNSLMSMGKNPLNAVTDGGAIFTVTSKTVHHNCAETRTEMDTGFCKYMYEFMYTCEYVCIHYVFLGSEVSENGISEIRLSSSDFQNISFQIRLSTAVFQNHIFQIGFPKS